MAQCEGWFPQAEEIDGNGFRLCVPAASWRNRGRFPCEWSPESFSSAGEGRAGELFGDAG